jgi:hypothetical protein
MEKGEKDGGETMLIITRRGKGHMQSLAHCQSHPLTAAGAWQARQPLQHRNSRSVDSIEWERVRCEDVDGTQSLIGAARCEGCKRSSSDAGSSRDEFRFPPLPSLDLNCRIAVLNNSLRLSFVISTP